MALTSLRQAISTWPPASTARSMSPRSLMRSVYPSSSLFSSSLLPTCRPSCYLLRSSVCAWMWSPQTHIASPFECCQRACGPHHTIGPLTPLSHSQPRPQPEHMHAQAFFAISSPKASPFSTVCHDLGLNSVCSMDADGSLQLRHVLD